MAHVQQAATCPRQGHLLQPELETGTPAITLLAVGYLRGQLSCERFSLLCLSPLHHVEKALVRVLETLGALEILYHLLFKSMFHHTGLATFFTICLVLL